MAKFKVNKTKDYTIMSNYHLKEKEMSLKAKGLLSIMLSLPEDWDYSIAGLVSICKENESAIKGALSELKEFGYLEIIKLMPNESSNGRIDYEYNIYEMPKQEGKKQGVENLGVENLDVEILEVENQGQLNTNNKILNNKELNNKKLNNIYISNEQLKNEFEMLWKEYPNKQGKEKAFKSYTKARTKEKVDLSLIINGLKRYLIYCSQNKDWYSPKNGSTWFNQCGWNDEYPIKEITTKDLAPMMTFEKFREEK